MGEVAEAAWQHKMGDGPHDTESTFRAGAAWALREFATYYGENPDAVDDETPGDLRNEMRRWAERIERGE